MDMGKKIEMLRKERGLTLEELGEKVGVGKSTVRKWENGMIANMRRDKIAKIAFALGVTPGHLMGWEEESKEGKPASYSENEIAHIEKYRALDDRGRATVDYILDEEYYRAKKIQEALYYADDDEYAWYIYAGKIAAAGTWIYPGDIPIERIRERRLNGADYILGVSGDSMQPLYEDGDLLYIKKTTEIEFAEIGLFIVNGMYYVKEYAPDGLRSKNPNYATIPKSRDIIVVGKVIGKVEK